MAWIAIVIGAVFLANSANVLRKGLNLHRSLREMARQNGMEFSLPPIAIIAPMIHIAIMLAAGGAMMWGISRL